MPEREQAKPEPKAQRNFTDPDSRIMKDGASKSFEQCYNAQAAVDSTAQVIVAAALTQQTNDKQQLVPMMQKTIEKLGRAPPRPMQATSARLPSATQSSRGSTCWYLLIARSTRAPPNRTIRGHKSTQRCALCATGCANQPI